MRTTKIKIYEFTELSAASKPAALDNLYHKCKEYEWQYDFWTEAMQTVQSLAEDMNIVLNKYYDQGASLRFEWLGHFRDEYSVEEYAKEMSGRRLIKWIVTHINLPDYDYSPMCDDLYNLIDTFLTNITQNMDLTLEDFLNELTYEIESFFESEMDYECSEEYWEEHAKDLQIEFLKDGTIWEHQKEEG